MDVQIQQLQFEIVQKSILFMISNYFKQEITMKNGLTFECHTPTKKLNLEKKNVKSDLSHGTMIVVFVITS